MTKQYKQAEDKVVICSECKEIEITAEEKKLYEQKINEAVKEKEDKLKSFDDFISQIENGEEYEQD